MRNNQPVQNIEFPFPSGETLVSTTDLKGRILYCNAAFVAMSGFSREELLGQPHNIVRHPDMPRGAYQLMWDTLKSGEEFFALVKNMTADGHFYWVFANVTSDLDSNGRLKGYFSVRRQAPKNAIREITAVYEQMLRVEQQAGPANAPAASVKWLMDYLQARDTRYERFVLDLYQAGSGGQR